MSIFENRRVYRYVGPGEFLALVGQSPTRRLIESKTDFVSWMKQTRQTLDAQGEVTATFIVDTNARLWIADRRSEHIACTNGGLVFSAGEMTFQVATEIQVSAVTNQSTGFCPEPESWPSVAQALEHIGFAHPADFTTCFNFRRCLQCQSINLVKDDWFVCGVCDAELDRSWNFAN